MGSCVSCCPNGDQSSDRSSLIHADSTDSISRPISNRNTDLDDYADLNGTPPSPSSRFNRQNEIIHNNVCSNLIEFGHEVLYPAQCHDRMDQHELYINEFFANIHVRNPNVQYDNIDILQPPRNQVDELTQCLCDNLQDAIQKAGGLNNIEFII